jgi:hypothetical protein
MITGTKIKAIIRAHEVAGQLCLTNTMCYAILTAAADGYVNAAKIASGVFYQPNSAAYTLRTLYKQNIFRAERRVHQGSTMTDYFLTNDGEKIAAQLLS